MHMDSAYVDNHARPFMAVLLKPQGATPPVDATRTNVGRRLAIVLDGRVVGMPMMTAELRSAALPIMPQASTAAPAILAQRINAGTAAAL
jgi:hypothetical protein